MSQPTGAASSGGGRYTRSSNGLIGSMIVVVLLVVGVVVVRNFISRDPQFRAEPVDYLATVYAVQQTGLAPVYPPDLPTDWIATNVVFETADGEDGATSLVFGLSLLTDDDTFAGIRQEDATAEELLAEFVDEDRVDPEPELDVTGSVAPTWQGWSDAGGDHAYTAEVDGATVIVFGSAADADLRDLVASLSTAPAPAP